LGFHLLLLWWIDLVRGYFTSDIAKSTGLTPRTGLETTVFTPFFRETLYCFFGIIRMLPYFGKKCQFGGMAHEMGTTTPRQEISAVSVGKAQSPGL
jgi:hypothetical protein